MGPIDFFIAGVQKGGTTALDRYLRHHPGIQMASVKEVHLFDDESIDWTRPDYSRLHQSFNWTSGGVCRGEATPIYTYWPQAMERLQRYNHSAKLIVLLRHPSLRAYSQWRMEIKRGKDHLPFAEAVSGLGRSRVASAPHGVHRVYSYVERGFYAAQVQRMLALFPRNQLLFCRTDRLWSNPKNVLAAVEDFLGVPHHAIADRRYIVPELTWSNDTVLPPLRAALDDTFATDISETARLTGLDLDDWLAADYREPMVPDQAQAAT